MADTEVTEWVQDVPLIEVGEKVKGGVDGAANKSSKELIKRTDYLYAQLQALVVGGLSVLGKLDSEAELDAIDTTGLVKGTAYFVSGSLRVWNGEEWTDSGSLLGPRGINLLGTWPDAQELPAIASNEVGDAYIWKGDVNILIPVGEGETATREWASIGLKGPQGDSAYELAQDIDGFQGTKAQWLASLVGKSNYQIWLDQGNTGTEADFLATLKSTEPGPPGESVKGDPGDPATPFAIEGTVESADQLPTPGDARKAYYIGSHLFVWVESQSNYVDLGSVGGLSAYDLWKAEGNTGTLADFFEAYRSTVPGPKGDNGANVNVKGTLSTSDSLAALQDPQNQDAYAMSDTGNLWILIDGTWTDTGPWRGKSNYDLYVENGGQADQPTWLASLQGRDGEDGTNIQLKGIVPSYENLPTSPAEQDVYAVRDLNSIFAFINGGWDLMGQFKGEDGEDGQNGTSINVVKILTADDTAIPAAAGNAGKAYVDLDGHIWLSNNSIWIDVGPVGAAGPQGPQGTGFNLRGNVATAGQLPNTAQVQDGDAYITTIDKMLYVRVEGQWNGPFDIIGPEGRQGVPGPQGADGKSIAIMGSYTTDADLKAAHPTGNLGEGYLVGTHLWIWTTADGGKWIDVGEVRGPQGLPGPEGKASTKPGPKGERGTVWITLPAGQDEPSQGFAGNVGDWAVSDTFKVYYRSVNGWVYWGQLVAGDVNSPLESFGKAVRLGNQWVVLPIDEVEAPQDGKFYVRRLKAGSNPLATEWVALKEVPEELTAKDGKLYGRFWDAATTKFLWKEVAIPSGIADLVTKDGKQYARVFESGATTPIWKEIVTIADITAKDGKYYARFFAADGTAPIWKEVPVGISDLTTKDGKQYVRVYEVAGAAPIWKEFVLPTMDKYTLKMLAATTILDLSQAQVFSIANSSARTLAFMAQTQPAADRSMTVVLIINGAGVITWPANVVWTGSTQPILGATTTVVTLLWDGIGGRWIGSVGASI
jgi:hypothetical protein